MITADGLHLATLIIQVATILIYLVGFALLIHGAVRQRTAQRRLQRSLRELDASTQRLANLAASWSKEIEPSEAPRAS